MTTLSKLPKDLRSYFVKSAAYGAGIWLGISLLAASAIYLLMGFLGTPDIKRHIGFWVVVLVGVIQSVNCLFQVYRQAKKVAQEIERKEMADRGR